MRKKLTPRDNEIIRRLVVGQSPKEIAEDLGMHPATILKLSNKDPLFASELGALEYETRRRLTESMNRLDALSIIEDAAGRAAKLCDGVVGDGEVLDDPAAGNIDLTLRVRTAWDILDRKGLKGAEKRMVLNLSDLIIEAHRQSKEKKEAAGPLEALDDFIEGEEVK